jgi:predicted nucleotidyltransferase
MRLSQKEILDIRDVVSRFSPDYELYLHGSRISDELKGGDIDLFIILPDDIYNNVIRKKHYLESLISLELREQKIDITVISKSGAQSHDFFKNSKKIKIGPTFSG